MTVSLTAGLWFGLGAGLAFVFTVIALSVLAFFVATWWMDRQNRELTRRVLRERLKRDAE